VQRKTLFVPASVPWATGPCIPTGDLYCQTMVLAGVTSENNPKAPRQMSVFPFGRRCAPEKVGEIKSPRVSLYVHDTSEGSNLLFFST